VNETLSPPLQLQNYYKMRRTVIKYLKLIKFTMVTYEFAHGIKQC